ncbi:MULTISPECIES: helix-turn-helix domain-containing protein [Cyanophyceae]|uniref:helix-turn-helix domain-containing protein n=1 Tax=Cyanophyceae TaxID=3028117 RepID=UPI001686239E|nr:MULTISPECIES: helix-turn-helix domain-containing protein [Cyanophyceae]MBD1918445.1 helix-turn-helix domain-containing protein [Phormidium sp. FACHB-77]MBD2031334.1 helix-turn-helix domain-containing protein [Phormidium sp. FACHB-322]MBD2049454.1 helix-turn-helix domain-containing protein [Leptolyngbya sp. FACHB-60]
MHLLSQNLAPTPGETLAAYVQRGRMSLGLSQKELAEKAGIHPQSVGKIERGQTTRLKQKPKSGLAHALGISVDYLDAVCQGRTVEEIAALKFCPQCWVPGTSPDPMWTTPRSKHCFACGSKLQDRCSGCREPIASLKFRFCPYCGKSYKGGGSE